MPGLEPREQPLDLAAHREALVWQQDRLRVLRVEAFETPFAGRRSGRRERPPRAAPRDPLRPPRASRRAGCRVQIPCRTRSTSASAWAASFRRRYSSSRATSSCARILRRLFARPPPSRQQQFRLDLDQQRRLVDVLGRDVEVELLHQPQVLVELVADHRHRDVGDLDLVDRGSGEGGDRAGPRRRAAGRARKPAAGARPRPATGRSSLSHQPVVVELHRRRAPGPASRRARSRALVGSRRAAARADAPRSRYELFAPPSHRLEEGDRSGRPAASCRRRSRSSPRDTAARPARAAPAGDISRWNSKRLQLSGMPGILPPNARRVGEHLRALAADLVRRVGGRSCCRTTSTSCGRRGPGTFGVGVKSACGSGKTSP